METTLFGALPPVNCRAKMISQRMTDVWEFHGNLQKGTSSGGFLSGWGLCPPKLKFEDPSKLTSCDCRFIYKASSIPCVCEFRPQGRH